MTSPRKIWTFFLACLVFLVPMSVFAQAKISTQTLTAADLEPWLDGFMSNALSINQIQGAVVVVVKDGQIVSQRGYGFADAAARIPVDPENTLFRPGSISKLFVWTSIMQLVEQGKIGLDEDINIYLDFKVLGKDNAKITVRHLMTHRAGFEEFGKSGFFSDPALLEPLPTFVKRYTPRRIFAPGSTPAYSNYGSTLAAYIVERVSGLQFETYVERNIFTPLGMTHSTFRVPLPPRLTPFLSKGYLLAGGEPQPFEMSTLGPAGALTASTADMVKFMTAHLTAEQALDGKLLKPQTARLMHRSLIKEFPQLNGMALGFYENNVNGHKVIAHGGDLNLFHSNMSLFIDDGIGVYISMNSAGNNEFNLRLKLVSEFADRYLPMTAVGAKIDPDVAKLHISQVTGAYAATRRLESSFGRLAGLTGELSLSAGDDGVLVLRGNRQPMSFREISPYLWQEVHGPELLSVKMQSGKPVAMSINSYAPVIAFTPVDPFRSASVILPVVSSAFIFVLLSLLAWPLGAVARRFSGRVLSQNKDQRHAFLVRQWGSISLIVSIIVWVLLLIPNLSGFTEADNVQILTTQIVGIICVLISAICLVFVARGVFKANYRGVQILGISIWIVANLIVIWFYYSFNFLKIGTDI